MPGVSAGPGPVAAGSGLAPAAMAAGILETEPPRAGHGARRPSAPLDGLRSWTDLNNGAIHEARDGQRAPVEVSMLVITAVSR